jgi:hypothetical protein
VASTNRQAVSRGRADAEAGHSAAGGEAQRSDAAIGVLLEMQSNVSLCR